MERLEQRRDDKISYRANPCKGSQKCHKPQGTLKSMGAVYGKAFAIEIAVGASRFRAKTVGARKFASGGRVKSHIGVVYLTFVLCQAILKAARRCQMDIKTCEIYQQARFVEKERIEKLFASRPNGVADFVAQSHDAATQWAIEMVIMENPKYGYLLPLHRRSRKW